MSRPVPNGALESPEAILETLKQYFANLKGIENPPNSLDQALEELGEGRLGPRVREVISSEWDKAHQLLRSVFDLADEEQFPGLLEAATRRQDAFHRLGSAMVNRFHLPLPEQW